MSFYTSTKDAIKDFKKGKILIITDDANRENEGDFVACAELITAEKINFMITHGKGLLCAPLAPEIVDKLELPLMVDKTRNQEYTKCNFTVSLNAKGSKISTGISAYDRAETIKKLAHAKAKRTDFTEPGHIFPLRAQKHGVLARKGHTEATVDLARLCGFSCAGTLCEIIREDGRMARLPYLKKFAIKHGLKILTIKQLIEYRRLTEKLVEKIAEAFLPTKYGDFIVLVYKEILNEKEHIALVKGKISPDHQTLVRVHSECITGDLFKSLRCDCGYQLKKALQKIGENGSGVLLYLNQEGRGIGLSNKIKAYALQDKGEDTVTANEKLGFPPDMRDYHIGAQILRDIGIRKMNLLTNNSAKIEGIKAYGLKIVKRIPIETKPNKNNREYLLTKKTKMGHILHEV